MGSQGPDRAMCPSETLEKNPPLPLLAAGSYQQSLKFLVYDSITPIKTLLVTWHIHRVPLLPCVFTWLSYKDSSH